MARIMVCDEDPEVLRLETAILTKAGHEVVACASGIAALKELGVQPEDASVALPDLLVLDIMMPVIDGYAVASIMRNSPRTRALPILVVSALAELRTSFADSEVNGFMTKPFTPESLTSAVAKILARCKAQA
ncbi:MAG: response regulator [Elusimicrobia bacterium]|nr:response regulator [Elusimicrobiota bacterium]